MRKRAAISLYSGAGGLDLGLEAAGFETRVAVEIDPDAVQTLRANRPWPVIDRDIRKVSTKELLQTARLKVREADLLCGGIPCQPYSKSGFWASGDVARLKDRRAFTLREYLRVVREALPKVFILENVEGFAFFKKDEGLRYLKRAVARINRSRGVRYRLSWKKLNAADYGVPQERERFFVVGCRDGQDFVFPAATHGSSEAGAKLEPKQTAWDAIGDLDHIKDPTLRMNGRWADLLPSIPEGSNYLHHTDRGRGKPLFGYRRRYWSFLLKLAKDRPSWTITAEPGPAIGPFHWRNRRLSTKELCRLQTFPDGYRVVGNQRSAQRQIGNAVPCALAERLGLEIRRQVFRDRRVRKHLSLVPPRRLPVPKPQRRRPVPAQYLRQVKKDSAHPGTGKGRAALRRKRQARFGSARHLKKAA